MSEFGVPRPSDPRRGERIEEDRPVVDQPDDESAPPEDPAREPDPNHAPAHPTRPG